MSTPATAPAQPAAKPAPKGGVQKSNTHQCPLSLSQLAACGDKLKPYAKHNVCIYI